jgi:hypothetical protein
LLVFENIHVVMVTADCAELRHIAQLRLASTAAWFARCVICEGRNRPLDGATGIGHQIGSLPTQSARDANLTGRLKALVQLDETSVASATIDIPRSTTLCLKPYRCRK